MTAAAVAAAGLTPAGLEALDGRRLHNFERSTGWVDPLQPEAGRSKERMPLRLRKCELLSQVCLPTGANDETRTAAPTLPVKALVMTVTAQ